jgi:hypothetical protein
MAGRASTAALPTSEANSRCHVTASGSFLVIVSTTLLDEGEEFRCLVEPLTTHSDRTRLAAQRRRRRCGSGMGSRSLRSPKPPDNETSFGFSRASLRTPPVRCRACSTTSPHRVVRGSAHTGIAAGCTTSSPSRALAVSLRLAAQEKLRRLSSSAVATSREGHRSPRPGREGQRRRWGRWAIASRTSKALIPKWDQTFHPLVTPKGSPPHVPRVAQYRR